MVSGKHANQLKLQFLFPICLFYCLSVICMSFFTASRPFACFTSFWLIFTFSFLSSFRFSVFFCSVWFCYVCLRVSFRFPFVSNMVFWDAVDLFFLNIVQFDFIDVHCIFCTALCLISIDLHYIFSAAFGLIFNDLFFYFLCIFHACQWNFKYIWIPSSCTVLQLNIRNRTWSLSNIGGNQLNKQFRVIEIFFKGFEKAILEATR